jgi:hypothetical protein
MIFDRAEPDAVIAQFRLDLIGRIAGIGIVEKKKSMSFYCSHQPIWIDRFAYYESDAYWSVEVTGFRMVMISSNTGLRIVTTTI